MMSVGTVWITGISAAGKTTLGRGLVRSLRERGIASVEILDGEEVRARLDRQYGYTTAERSALSLFIAGLAEQANRDGKLAIVCAISHVHETRLEIRGRLGHFMEVFLDCPVEAAAARDYKDQYARAFAGDIDNFIGVTEPYQPSDHPELVLATASEPPERSLERLNEAVLEFIGLPLRKADSGL